MYALKLVLFQAYRRVAQWLERSPRSW